MKVKTRLDVAAAALAFGLAAAFLVVLPAGSWLRGLSIDLTTALAAKIARAPAPQSPTVVIALDEETFKAAPFRGSPMLFWTGELARVVSAALEGGAVVVGFDVVFADSVEESEIHFGDGTVGSRMHGFDRDFLRMLATYSRAGKIVLGEAQIAEQRLMPASGQRFAVGALDNIAALNVLADADGIVRRVPLYGSDREGRRKTMAFALASRAGAASPPPGASAVPGALTLNFGDERIPAFSLADLSACLDKGDTTFFRRAFAGRIVLVGLASQAGDRLWASDRFAAPPGVAAERCALPEPVAAGVVAADGSISGVYVHATAANDIVGGRVLSEAGGTARVVIALAAAAPAALATLILGPLIAGAALAGFWLLWLVACVTAFQHSFAWPTLEPAAAGFLALAAATAFRAGLKDREQRFLRDAFGLYLAPAMIEKIAASKLLPALGGETRDVTIMFTDLAGYSTLSEAMAPADVVALMSEYFEEMTVAIEQSGGYIDKYIGDAIVAIFGAPLASDTHAADAVVAAFRCNARLRGFNEARARKGQPPIRHRVGLHSGAAMVGNVGSRRRFNYTAMGDTVNLASRLESLNKNYGAEIIASEAVKQRAGDAFGWRELDVLRVRGRAAPVKIFEPTPLGEAAGAPVARTREQVSREPQVSSD